LNNEVSGPKLVDLFTPEFCLKVGDTFVKIIQTDDDTSKPAVVTQWLQKQQRQRANNMEDAINPHQELTHLVTELIEQKET